MGPAYALRHKRTCLPPCKPDCTAYASTCPERKGGGLVFREPKEKSRRTVPLAPELIPMLKAHRAAQLRQRLVAGEEWQEHDLVFSRPDGHPIDPRDDFTEWKALLAAAGVRDARLHDSRHTSATLLLEQEAGIRVVMELLGHSDLRFTTRYTHVVSPPAIEATRRLG